MIDKKLVFASLASALLSATVTGAVVYFAVKPSASISSQPQPPAPTTIEQITPTPTPTVEPPTSTQKPSNNNTTPTPIFHTQAFQLFEFLGGNIYEFTVSVPFEYSVKVSPRKIDTAELRLKDKKLLMTVRVLPEAFPGNAPKFLSKTFKTKDLGEVVWIKTDYGAIELRRVPSDKKSWASAYVNSELMATFRCADTKLLDKCTQVVKNMRVKIVAKHIVRSFKLKDAEGNIFEYRVNTRFITTQKVLDDHYAEIYGPDNHLLLKIEQYSEAYPAHIEKLLGKEFETIRLGKAHWVKLKDGYITLVGKIYNTRVNALGRTIEPPWAYSAISRDFQSVKYIGKFICVNPKALDMCTELVTNLDVELLPKGR